MKRMPIALLLSLVLVIMTPCAAFARSFGVDAVSFDAVLEKDGSLDVTEQREYDFSGSFNGIYWDLPRGTYEGRDVDAAISGVAVVTADGGSTPLTESSSGDPGSYSVDAQYDYYRLTIYWPASDETVTFQVSYELDQLATRWSDVGELYWQYVQADPDADSAWHNVKAQVSLSVPDGAQVNPGDNVRAWAHGPLDGTVSFDGDHIVFFSPAVGTQEYLEMRVTLPQDWLPEASQESEPRLDAILAEEHEWVADANARRRSARLTVWGIPGLLSLMGAACFVLAGVQKHRSAQHRIKARFDDTYFRDVPTKDHPAVLGMLYHNGSLTEKEFTATMCLTDQGRLGLDPVRAEKTGFFGKAKDKGEWRLVGKGDTFRRPGDNAPGVREIDDAAYNFLFDVVAPRSPQHLGVSGVEPSVFTSDFEEVAHAAPQDYYDGYHAWSDTVEQVFGQCPYRALSAEGSAAWGIIGLACIVLTLLLAGVGVLLGVPTLPLALGLCLGFAGGVCLVLADNSEPVYVLTQEGADVMAQLEALKRWLTDFTRLEEAIPTDVVLWNRLLVMATVLGVADKVIEQLKVAMPQLLLDSNFAAYSWYSDMEGLGMPAYVMTNSYEQARSVANGELFHDVSNTDLAGSIDSSFGGGGGGFSGGGGGGFSGGGGRGGAF